MFQLTGVDRIGNGAADHIQLVRNVVFISRLIRHTLTGLEFARISTESCMYIGKSLLKRAFSFLLTRYPGCERGPVQSYHFLEWIAFIWDRRSAASVRERVASLMYYIHHSTGNHW